MKNATSEATQDIDWCKTQIAIAESGGDTKPHSRLEWIACMNRRIKANLDLLEQYGATYTPANAAVGRKEGRTGN